MSEKNGENNQLLTTSEVATQLRVHTRTVQRWIASGQLKACKVGPRVWRIGKEDLDVFIKVRNKNIEQEDNI